MLKLKSAVGEPRWNHALARKQKFVGRTSEQQPKRERRNGEQRRTVQRSGERAGELGVGDRLRRGDVEGPVAVPVEYVADGTHGILQRYPRHPLAATTERPTHPEPKRK